MSSIPFLARFLSLIASSHWEQDLNGGWGVNWFEGLLTRHTLANGELGRCLWPLKSAAWHECCHVLFRQKVSWLMPLGALEYRQHDQTSSFPSNATFSLPILGPIKSKNLHSFQCSCGVKANILCCWLHPPKVIIHSGHAFHWDHF